MNKIFGWGYIARTPSTKKVGKNSLTNTWTKRHYGTTPRIKHYATPITPKLAQKFDEINTLQKKIDQAKLNINENLTRSIQNMLKMHWTYNSNAIEGNTLTLSDTMFYLKEGLTVGGKPLRDFLDTTAHANAINYLYRYLEHDTEFSTFFIKTVNKILLERAAAVNDDVGTLHFTPGEYKTIPNYVERPEGIHQYLDPLLVPAEMDYLFRWLNENIDTAHPIWLAAIAHYDIASIHPFNDRNGRSARILMNLALLKKKFPPAIIRVLDREQYLHTLKKADKGDIHPFVEFIADSLQNIQKMIYSELKKHGADRSPKSTPL